MMSSLHVPEWLLERLAAGELDADQAAALRARLEHAGELHRLEAIEKSNAEILSALPPGQVVPEIQRRLAQRARRTKAIRTRWTLGLATACAAGLAVFLVVKGKNTAPLPGAWPGQETILLKGHAPPRLMVYRRTNHGHEQLAADQKLHPGDALQIRYLSAKNQYGVIASIDARGTITLHLPERPGTAAPLQQEGEFALSHSYELDDSPGFERFLFLASDTPFPTQVATDLLNKKAPPPKNFSAYAITFKKESP